ncbi:beta-ketoacyl synthase chain length factor [Testudinibacter sp. TR-2022]|uniref:beta-ketoacyl synthase chain length factor n=1 Tax=Testudinibacter sp. TR-2022 TaxID=2585029 RepID=UPI00111A25D5|nr:beta-ketoacyl synthase chain length factor [Testudinibacter sp. TR-2022]TNH06005.1 beta-ketoacyl synthase chain length factor [Pasteurellaceae bacterium Phil11]TNH24294.1 beta-ketoacyl synthase chain length factor [Testudinibacter sp. TR-2022]TNH26885.1 beta-ketoacyl synthase chain length factor [Testudinibacter sp. TR-2022]
MFDFDIACLKAYSSALNDEAQWQEWADSDVQNLPKSTQASFKPSLIPLMQARRMGVADKMAIQLALELNQQHDIDAVVFASRHGQLARTYKLLSSFFAQGEMSPTDFATAVHNAPSGQFSILAKQTAPISSVAAEANTFCAALLEALLCLQDGKSNVLLVVFDDEIPHFYKPFLSQAEQQTAYAFAMVLTPGSQWHVAFQAAEQACKESFPDGLAFLREYYRGTPQFALTYGWQQWRFSQQ